VTFPGDDERIEALRAELVRRTTELFWKVVGFGLFCAAWGAMLVWVLFL
jgi:hypothetical protein